MTLAADPPPRPSRLAALGPHPVRGVILPALFVLALFIAVWMRQPDGSQPGSELSMWSGPTMGTTYQVKARCSQPTPERHREIHRRIEEALERVNAAMSTYRPDSELSKFNDNRTSEPVAISSELAFVVEAALAISRATDGAFDITVGPLVDAWGFGPPGEPPTPPSPSLLESLRERVGYSGLSLTAAPHTLSKRHPLMHLDLSAIAKGYGVDEVARALDQSDCKDYLVEVGGELRARGMKAPGVAWRVGIEAPVDHQRMVQRAIPLTDRAMATSGDYRNFYERDGVRISHTIDPRTQRPIEHRLASVTVLAEDCMTADAWATALNVLGPAEGPATARRLNLDAHFMVRKQDGTTEEISVGWFAKQPQS